MTNAIKWYQPPGRQCLLLSGRDSALIAVLYAGLINGHTHERRFNAVMTDWARPDVTPE